MSFPGASWGLSEMWFASYALDVKSQNPGQGLLDKPSPPTSDYLNFHVSTCQKLLFWRWSSALFLIIFIQSWKYLTLAWGKRKFKKKENALNGWWEQHLRWQSKQLAHIDFLTISWDLFPFVHVDGHKLILFPLLPLEVLLQVANHQFSICLHTLLLLLVYYCLLQACCSPNFSQNYALYCSEPEDGNVHFFFLSCNISKVYFLFPWQWDGNTATDISCCEHKCTLTCEHTGPLQQSQPLLDNL